MIWQTCEVCERDYPTPEAYRKLCLPCWKRTHGIELTATDRALVEALAQVHILNQQLAASAHATPSPPPPVAVPQLSSARIRALITLCHPDKHANSTKATEVTRWLLTLR